MPRQWISRGDKDMMIKCVAVGRVTEITKCWFSSVVLFVLFCFHCFTKICLLFLHGCCCQPSLLGWEEIPWKSLSFPNLSSDSFSATLSEEWEHPHLITHLVCLSSPGAPSHLSASLQPLIPQRTWAISAATCDLETIRHYLCLYCMSSPGEIIQVQMETCPRGSWGKNAKRKIHLGVPEGWWHPCEVWNNFFAFVFLNLQLVSPGMSGMSRLTLQLELSLQVFGWE